MNIPLTRRLLALLLPLLLAACAVQPPTPTPPAAVRPAPKVALVLGGGAARGFAHIGVIKVLEAQGIKVDIVAGTSAGSVVGALYAAGLNGFQLQKVAMEMQEDSFTDWMLPNRGVLRGEALQDFINRAVKNQPMEKLARPLGVVATELRSGERTVFRTGNTGMAVRASSTVPGVFQPVNINGKEYVDGGLTSPVPVQAARDMGADFVIAVDISNVGSRKDLSGTLEILLQTFAIMGRSLSLHELPEADIVIHPRTVALSTTSFDDRHLAILEGEKAATAILPQLKARLAAWKGR